MARAVTAAADLLGAVGAQFFLWDKQQNTTPFAIVGRLPEEGNEAYLRYYSAFDTRRQALERVPVGKVATYDLEFDGGGSARASSSTISRPLWRPLRRGQPGAPHGGAVGRDRGPPEFSPRSVRGAGDSHARAPRSASPACGAAASPDARDEAAEPGGRGCSRSAPVRVVIADATGRALMRQSCGRGDGGGERWPALARRAPRGSSSGRDGGARPAYRRGGPDRRSPQRARRRRASGLPAVRPPTVRVADRAAQSRGRPSPPHRTACSPDPLTDLDSRPELLGPAARGTVRPHAAEACLAVAVAGGKRLEDVAEERGVRMPTLRTQLRAILDKTGTRRQPDLMRLIVGLPAVSEPWIATSVSAPVSLRARRSHARPDKPSLPRLPPGCRRATAIRRHPE